MEIEKEINFDEARMKKNAHTVDRKCQAWYSMLMSCSNPIKKGKSIKCMNQTAARIQSWIQWRPFQLFDMFTDFT